MSIVLNGAPRAVDAATTVAGVVSLLTTSTSGCAVAVNDEVVPRRDWAGRVLEAGDRVEVLTAVQGG